MKMVKMIQTVDSLSDGTDVTHIITLINCGVTTYHTLDLATRSWFVIKQHYFVELKISEAST